MASRKNPIPLPDGFRVQDQAVSHAPYFEGRGRESDGPEEDSDEDDHGGGLKEEHEASSSIVVASSSGSEDNGTVESGGERPRKRKRGESSGSGAIDGGSDGVGDGDGTVEVQEQQQVGFDHDRGAHPLLTSGERPRPVESVTHFHKTYPALMFLLILFLTFASPIPLVFTASLLPPLGFVFCHFRSPRFSTSLHTARVLTLQLTRLEMVSMILPTTEERWSVAPAVRENVLLAILVNGLRWRWLLLVRLLELHGLLQSRMRIIGVGKR